MEPLTVLTAVTAVLLFIGRWRGNSLRRLPVALRGGLAAMFLLTGVSHFVGMRADLIAMVPPALPAPELLITLTGVAELAAAIGLLWRPTVLPAAAGLTALLIGMFPANIYAAVAGLQTAWYDQVVPRTVMQAIFLAATLTVLVDGIRHHRENRRDLAPAGLTAPSGRRSAGRRSVRRIAPAGRVR